MQKGKLISIHVFELLLLLLYFTYLPFRHGNYSKVFPEISDFDNNCLP